MITTANQKTLIHITDDVAVKQDLIFMITLGFKF